jgi:flagellar M-ring protein FliF
MEPMNILDMVRRFWSTKNTQQKTNIVIVTAIFVATCALLFTWASRPDFKPLFTNLSSKDASAIAKRLAEEKIPYKLENEGNTILVPQRFLYETRLKLAGAGLPENGTVGFELFDKMNLQTSEFIENVNYVRALQGELAKTISSIEEVKGARVMLNIPKTTIYMEDEAPPSASIVLSLGGGRGLGSEKVQSIAFLVASSVKNLKPENITIVDDKGNLLYSPELAGGGFSSSSQYQLQRNFQKEMEQKVQGALDRIFGSGKSLVKVSVELDFDKQTIDRETYQPVDKNLGLLRSAQENTEVYSEAPSKAPGSAAPAASPAPSSAAAAPGGKPAYDQRNYIKNYELNKSKEHRVTAPGKIKRISAGVFLDKSIALDDKGIKNINEVLESSIGIDSSRGDTVKIKSFAFNTDYWKEQQAAMQEQEKKAGLFNIIKMASPALAVLIFIFFYLIMLKKLQNIKTVPMLQAGAQPETLAPREMAAPIARIAGPPAGATMAQLSPLDSGSSHEMEPDGETIRKLALEDPGKIAGMIEALLSRGE